jgi:hypothetical protein
MSKFKQYVVYEFIDGECQGSDYVTTFKEAERIAMNLYNNGSDATICGIDTDGDEIDLGEKGEFTHSETEE